MSRLMLMSFTGKSFHSISILRGVPMINIIIVISVIGLFIVYQLPLTIGAVFLDRSRWGGLCDRLVTRATSVVLRLFRCYRGFVLDVRYPQGGLEFPRRFLLVSNHQSLIDIPVLMALMPEGTYARFMAKHSLGVGIPFLSSVLKLGGHCLVRRSGDPMESMRQVSAFGKRCSHDGTCPVIFPEGTRSRNGELGTFHSAGFRKVLEAENVPIVVVAIEGGWKSATLRTFFRYFGSEPYRVSFEAVLPAPKGRKDALETLECSRVLIEKALLRMRSKG